MLRLCLGLVLVVCAGAQPSLFDQLKWRMIGPFRGGRVVAVSGVAGDDATFYFGAVGGGVWKTTDAGTVWRPIFDSQKISSIGAIAVAPSDPNVIYVGTGEADIRSQIGFGDGVYKSTDAGRTWTNVGLRDSRQIAKIVVDPHDPDLVYAAALGHVYGPNAERGVFRSSDGGRSWRKVLDRGPSVGAADLAMDPANPKTLYACMWAGSRPPWSQYPALEGEGSGLFQSTDGGDTWKDLKGHGLPETRWGRSGVAVFPGGKRVYTVVSADAASGLYRSDDGGVTWVRATGDKRLTERAWYFCGVTVDPKNPDLVYLPNVALFRSEDAGRNFTVLKGAPGGDDYHILWIDPTEPRRMLLGSDQGTNVSVDAGRTWSTWFNQPTAQMYHVTTDNRFPYAVYGAQQDSGTAAVMSRTDHGAIDARDWFTVGGEEAGYIVVDSRDEDIVYVGDAQGSLSRYDRHTGQAQNITPWPLQNFDDAGGIGTARYRYPWTAPLVASIREPGALFFGSQYVMKTVDGGLTWKQLSSDLAGDAKGVVYAIAPSPVDAEVIWAGTDTGRIHVTRDGGRNWANVTPPKLSHWSKVSQIEASHFDAGTAYVSVDRHRIEDYSPYVYRTRDYGRNWELVTEGLVAPAFVNGVREDPARRGLLYACTELGISVSFDDGARWQSLQLNLPTVSIRDLTVHGDDLVIATFGRGFWILDDAAPLRQIDENAARMETLLYKPAKAIRLNPVAFTGTPFPPEEPKAKNPPEGAMIDYYFRSVPAGEVALEIRDGKGALVRRFSTGDPVPPPPTPGAIADEWLPAPERLTAKPGMNRFVWDLRYDAKGTEAGGEDDFGQYAPGPQVLPGTYQVRLIADGRTYTQELEVALDPRSKATVEDLSKQLELGLAILQAIGEASEAMRSAGSEAKSAELHAVASDLVSALRVVESADRTPPAVAWQIYEDARRKLKSGSR